MFAKYEKQAVSVFRKNVKSPIARGRFAKRVSAHFGRDYSVGKGLLRILNGSKVHSAQPYVEFFVDDKGLLEFSLMIRVKHDDCPEGESFDDGEAIGYSTFSINEPEILRRGKIERGKHLSKKLKEEYVEDGLPR